MFRVQSLGCFHPCDLNCFRIDLLIRHFNFLQVMAPRSKRDRLSFVWYLVRFAIKITIKSRRTIVMSSYFLSQPFNGLFEAVIYIYYDCDDVMTNRWLLCHGGSAIVGDARCLHRWQCFKLRANGYHRCILVKVISKMHKESDCPLALLYW